MAREFSKADEPIVRAAMGKRLAGVKLTGEEQRALSRWERRIGTATGQSPPES